MLRLRNQTVAVMLIWAIECLNAGWAQEPVNPNLSPTARTVWDYLRQVYQKQCLSGYNVYVHTPDDYEQTGKQAAVWGRDIRWLGDTQAIIAHARQNGYILTLHWHWFVNGDSAWTQKRQTPVDVGRLITPGTPEHAQMMTELSAAADTLQILAEADVPVLWRPLHEIDGGWFWWTDKEQPENTAQLWRLMFDYFTHTRELNNLIWVYSAGVGNKALAYRQGFYPGADYVDISGIDIYGVDFQKDIDKYWDYWNTMSQVSPGKMLACGECDAIPDPNKMATGVTPRWLYALPWWGVPSAHRSVEWATYAMQHDYILTLEKLPAFGSLNLPPHVNILAPRDNGSAWFPQSAPRFETEAVDRDGHIQRVDYFAGDTRIGTVDSPPYQFTWQDPTIGCHDITAVAVDNANQSKTSNRVRIVVGLKDAARHRPVVASSGESPEQAVDGDYYTAWSCARTDNEWLYVDLGQTINVDRVNLIWGWKIHAQDYTIDVATEKPDRETSWRTVHKRENRPYQAWKATDRITFRPTPARYVRLHARKRAGKQTWGGYQLMALEVPVMAK